MALKSGVDAVIELPPLFSLSSAEHFAFSSVYLLNATGIIDCICFGSEDTDFNKIMRAADILSNESEEFKTLLFEQLRLGKGYASARHHAANIISGEHLPLDMPNCILAVEYLKALKRLKSRMTPFVSPHLECDSNQYKSASSIREAIFSGCFTASESCMPDECYQILRNSSAFTSINDFSLLLHQALITKTNHELSEIFEVSEGIQNRIISAAQSHYHITEIIETAKTKRYTATRLQRVIMNTILGVTTNFFNKYSGKPPYIRLLGFNSQKEYLVRQIVKNATLPVITNVKKDYERLLKECPSAAEMLRFDMMASEIYGAASKSPVNEFQYQLVII